ncbi:MAG: Mur ligase family protein, partial [Cyanobacteria bacterium]|nr:Mur ligase family protein [Cyanobacteriota bacterium]
GKVARKIDPSLLASFGKQIQQKTIAVTGTNGKTTTCGLLSQFLEEAGHRVVHNQLGANMIPGITAAILNQSSLLGKLNAAYGVLEVDEASLRAVSKEIPADIIVVTNLFRDQLDRYGELDTTQKMIEAGIPEQCSTLILNGDDPLVTSIHPPTHTANASRSPQRHCLYFGIKTVVYPALSASENNKNPEIEISGGITGRIHEFPVAFPREVSQCPSCGGDLIYLETIFGHLGNYHCKGCAYQRPPLDITAKRVVVDPLGCQLKIQYGRHPETPVIDIYLPLPGLFNVYNFLAALSVLYATGMEAHEVTPWIEGGFKHFQSVFGRAERQSIEGKQVLVMLIKNPVGASEVLKLVSADPKANVLIALNDNYADGRDISWIWDAMFEGLALQQADSPAIVVSGDRAEDLAVRLRYAGVPPHRILVESDLDQAVRVALHQTTDDRVLYILPTYTALLSLRKQFKHL